MTVLPSSRRLLHAGLIVLGAAAAAVAGAQDARPPATVAPGDHIVAVVNQELVTAVELARRTADLAEAARRAGVPVPPEEERRKQALDQLIDERAVVTYARDQGWRIDDVEVDRAVANVAAMNQLSVEQLRARLAADGIDMARFRAQLRDQIAVERTREREVIARIVVTDEEIDRELAEQRAASRSEAELNIAQILIPVPEGADAATVAERRARAEQALARIKAGEDFAAVARDLSQDPNRASGGELGLRGADRLPDLFVASVRDLKPGEVRGEPVRSGAGWHVLKLVERREPPGADATTETRARHILLRAGSREDAERAARRLAELRRQIVSGERRFEVVAREISEDGSAAQGGDLGWFGPGAMVPEFELPAANLPIGEVSEPVVSRFGVHLIQVLERRQTQMAPAERREQVRNVLRERKFERAFEDWVKELRARAYVEMREAPAS